MAQLVFILGNSGTGKSRSIKTLPMEETLVINVNNKPLPFKNSYTKLDSKTKTGNIISIDNVETIMKIITQTINLGMKFNYIIIDDFNYLMSNEFFYRAKEKGYEKFTDIGKKMFDLLNFIRNNIPNNVIVFLLAHTEIIATQDGIITKIKTIGKLLDEKYTLEGLATIVLGTLVKKDASANKLEYYFVTQNDGTNTLKSPEEMFDGLEIPNDLGYVATKIKEYYPIIFNQEVK